MVNLLTVVILPLVIGLGAAIIYTVGAPVVQVRYEEWRRKLAAEVSLWIEMLEKWNATSQFGSCTYGYEGIVFNRSSDPDYFASSDPRARTRFQKRFAELWNLWEESKHESDNRKEHIKTLFEEFDKLAIARVLEKWRVKIRESGQEIPAYQTISSSDWNKVKWYEPKHLSYVLFEEAHPMWQRGFVIQKVSTPNATLFEIRSPYFNGGLAYAGQEELGLLKEMMDRFVIDENVKAMTSTIECSTKTDQELTSKAVADFEKCRQSTIAKLKWDNRLI